MTPFKWHETEWTPELISRFWDYMAQRQELLPRYFTRQVGSGIVNFLRFLTPMKGHILDFGCGPGYLIEQLLKAGVSCDGADSSAKTVALVNTHFAGHPLLGGAQIVVDNRLSCEDGVYDLIICTETIEHFIPEQRDKLLCELRRLLKPSTGRLLITTPDSEDLRGNSVCCPECGALFHPVQHLVSYNYLTLPALMEGKGFLTELCSVTIFSSFNQVDVSRLWSDSPIPEISRNDWIKDGFKDLLRGVTGTCRSRRFQRLIGTGYHLFWFGGVNSLA